MPKPIRLTKPGVTAHEKLAAHSRKKSDEFKRLKALATKITTVKRVK